MYGVRYEDVGVDEAIDLIETLPRGSLWRSASSPFGEWTDERERAAEIVDHIERMIALYATGTTEGSLRVTRPSDLAAMAEGGGRRGRRPHQIHRMGGGHGR